MCAFGAPFEKPTVVAGSAPGLAGLARRCPGGHEHVLLQVSGPDGSRTAAAASYHPTFPREPPLAAPGGPTGGDLARRRAPRRQGVAWGSGGGPRVGVWLRARCAIGVASVAPSHSCLSRAAPGLLVCHHLYLLIRLSVPPTGTLYKNKSYVLPVAKMKAGSRFRARRNNPYDCGHE